MPKQFKNCSDFMGFNRLEHQTDSTGYRQSRQEPKVRK